MSSASEAATPSDRNAAREVGVAHTSEEAGQRPRSKGAAQGKLLDEGTTAAPEAELTVSPKLAELVARARKEDRLTNVVQFVDEELLHLAFRSLRKRAAPGVDGQRYEDYAANLDANLKDVYERLRTGRYRAPVVRRAHIPKANGGRRPLGITTIEDRVVQKAVAWVLSAVFEQDFLECSHGFRPGRSAHTALHRVREGMMQHWVKYVVEVDVVGYFDHVGHGWLLKFLRHRVNDGGLLRLVSKCSLCRHRHKLHKRRNVLEHLPQEQRERVGRQLDRAWAKPEYSAALTALKDVTKQLDEHYPGAAGSLREGLEETLTITQLHIPSSLTGTLFSTNPIESMNSISRTAMRNVKHWRSGTMVCRWTAAALEVASAKFRRIKGYRELPLLLAALAARTQNPTEQAARIA